MSRTGLPPWVVDDKTSIKREAALYRAMTRAERMRTLAGLCRMAARQLAARPDEMRLREYRDPLPKSTERILKQLRENARATE